MRKIIKQYITCRHKENVVIREVLDYSTVGLGKTMKWYDPFFLFTNQPFVAVIKVTPGQDESATLFKLYKEPEELEKEADDIETVF